MKQWSRWVAIAVLTLVFTGLYVYVNQVLVEDREQVKDTFYVRAKVVQMLQDNTVMDSNSEGILRGSQEVIAEVVSGDYKGKQYQTTNYLSLLYNVNAQVGTKVILCMNVRSSGEINASIYSYDRAEILLGSIGIFAFLLCLIGGKKGFMSLLSLLFTLLSVWKLLFPMMMYGVPVLLATILVVVMSTIATFLFVDGINRKTISAAIGTISGVIIAAIFAVILGKLTHITGLQTTESEELLLTGTSYGMKLKHLLTAGVLLSALGAVMDVAMSIASAIHELKQVNPQLSSKEMFRSGMNIGRDAMGTMSNTLILAFVGSSFTLILLIYSYNIPLVQLVNTDLVAREVIQGMAGSVGIILTVPIVALVSSIIEDFGKDSKRA